MTDKVSSTNQFKCRQCGAELTYAPGTNKLLCQYCGAENQIASSPSTTPAEETDYQKFLAESNLSADQKHQVHTVKCQACGAESTLKPNVSADRCPFCDTPLVLNQTQTTTIIKPRYLLPFKIDLKQAKEAFRNWIKKLWFAPSKLRLYADNTERLNGMYIPYWTFDSNTFTHYSGERGNNYQEHYTVTVGGKTENRTRTKIRWIPVSGSVRNSFDDVLVIASQSLPEKKTRALEPWDLANLTGYNESYLSGFRSETYQLNVQEGFEKAKAIMEEEIRSTVRRDIGGDHQRIHNTQTAYHDISFKHILLPIWLSAYRFGQKVYRFVINGRTGEVQGERPYSWIKITLAVLAAAAVGTGIYFLIQHFNG